MYPLCEDSGEMGFGFRFRSSSSPEQVAYFCLTSTVMCMILPTRADSWVDESQLCGPFLAFAFSLFAHPHSANLMPRSLSCPYSTFIFKKSRWWRENKGMNMQKWDMNLGKHLGVHWWQSKQKGGAKEAGGWFKRRSGGLRSILFVPKQNF